MRAVTGGSGDHKASEPAARIESAQAVPTSPLSKEPYCKKPAEKGLFDTVADGFFEWLSKGFDKLPTWAQKLVILLILGGVIAMAIWVLCQN